jgi:hypothetical protein
VELFAAADWSMTTDRLKQTVRAILHNDWDPIGIAGFREAADEYDRYVGPVAQMIVAGTSASDLSNYRIGVETQTMSLNGDHDRVGAVAAKLKSIARETSTRG